MQKIEESFKYETGEVQLGNGLAKVKIPQGFKFLNKEQAIRVVYDVWGNMRGDEDKVHGLLVPSEMGVTSPGSWAFVIEYDDMGFVKDDDADKINYDDLLKQMKEGEDEVNKERMKLGMESMSLVGWAQKPYYDKEKKVLHWAKEFKVGNQEENTLNYNIRVLGRKGVLVLNAVGGMSNLEDVNKNITGVIGSVEFGEGNRYSDFNPSVDKVAGWTIGGLVAGKVLAKAGILAFLAKFAKVIFFGVVAAGGAVWQFIRGKFRKEEEAEKVVEETNAMA
jgi:uncharacterized membrane-anchored protein